MYNYNIILMDYIWMETSLNRKEIKEVFSILNRLEVV